MEWRFAAAIEKSDVRPAVGDVLTGRTLSASSGTLDLVGPEHAVNAETTLCGIPRDDVIVMRHLWSNSREHSCGVCKDVFYRITPDIEN